jgi:AcrR family transcriptional regulator
VLIDAALQLVGEGGADAVSVREAARRAGVSPGAPFRHFPSRDALMNAVAEEAQRRFRAEIEAALAEAPASDPLGRFRCLGVAYLRWALRNPTHFEIISSRRLFDHDKVAAVSRDNAELIEMTERTLAEAFAQGQLRALDLKQVQIAGRALVYGFARMNIDGHFPRWGVADRDAEGTAAGIIDLFIEGIAKRPGNPD